MPMSTVRPKEPEFVSETSTEDTVAQAIELFCWVCGDVADDHRLICVSCRDELARDDAED